MKKVTAFIGSARKKATYHAVQEFERSLKSHGDIDFEYVFLNEFNLKFCEGCLLCFIKGEEFCPLNDDRDVLLEKIEHSDGVVFATPSYAFQVSARMKNFLDRTAFIYHRPRYFDKTFTAIIAAGIFFGGNSVRKYLESMGRTYGFRVVKGSVLFTLQPMTERQEKKVSLEMKKLAERYYKELNRMTMKKPSLFRLMMFRFARTGIQNVDVKNKDYFYYKEKGWFESDYFYNTSLGMSKKFAGHLSDFLARQFFKHR